MRIILHFAYLSREEQSNIAIIHCCHPEQSEGSEYILLRLTQRTKTGGKET